MIARLLTVSSSGRPPIVSRYTSPPGGTDGPAETIRPAATNAEPTPVPSVIATARPYPRAAPASHSPRPNASASFTKATRARPARSRGRRGRRGRASRPPRAPACRSSHHSLHHPRPARFVRHDVVAPHGRGDDDGLRVGEPVRPTRPVEGHAVPLDKVEH